jgi:hypothetical protein
MTAGEDDRYSGYAHRRERWERGPFVIKKEREMIDQGIVFWKLERENSEI